MTESSHKFIPLEMEGYLDKQTGSYTVTFHVSKCDCEALGEMKRAFDSFLVEIKGV